MMHRTVVILSPETTNVISPSDTNISNGAGCCFLAPWFRRTGGSFSRVASALPAEVQRTQSNGEYMAKALRDWNPQSPFKVEIYDPSAPPTSRGDDVFLVCLDESFTGNNSFVHYVKELYKTVGAESERLVPVLMPSYDCSRRESSQWWPSNVPEMQVHKQFIDLRSLDEWKLKMEQVLLPKITGKDKDKWAALTGISARDVTPPIRTLAESLRGKSLARIDALETMKEYYVCAACVDSGSLDPGKFDKKLLKKEHWQWLQLVRRGLSQATIPLLQCSSGHVQSTAEALSRSLEHARPSCPACYKSRRSGTFDFDDCMQMLRMQGPSATKTCLECAQSGSSDGKVLVKDVLSPDVFISSGLDTELQEEVNGICKRVERLTGVAMWPRFDKASAGDAMIEWTSDAISQTNIFIMFLSDAFFNSGGSVMCLQELSIAQLGAANHTLFCKITTVVYELTSNSSSIPFSKNSSLYIVLILSQGWTGPHEPNSAWWKHAEELYKMNPTKLSEKSIDWASLGDLPPALDMRHMSATHGDGIWVQGFTVESILTELILLRSKSPHKAKDREYSFWRGKMIEAQIEEDMLEEFESPTQEVLDERLRLAFDGIDTDHSGGIDKQELKAALKRAEVQCTDEEVENMLRQADLNNDQYIQPDEFMNVMKSLISLRSLS